MFWKGTISGWECPVRNWTNTPVIGALKYSDEIGTLFKSADKVSVVTRSTDGAGVLAKHADEAGA